MDLLQIAFPVAGIKAPVFIPPAVAFIISFFTSMAGISGAFLLLPFQMSILGFTAVSVTSTNFLFNVTGTPGGIYRYVKECRFVWPVALNIVCGIIPGVLIGYYIRLRLLPDPKSFKLFVGIILLFVGLKLIRHTWTRKKAARSFSCGLTDRVIDSSIGFKRTRFLFRGTFYAFSTAGLFGLSFLVGIIGGTYGIGGGSIIAPFLISLFGLPIYAVAGAVLMGTFASSAAGVLFYSLVPIGGTVAPPDWKLGILFGVGGLLGMYCGAKMQRHISERLIKRFLGIIVMIIAVRYIFRFFNADVFL